MVWLCFSYHGVVKLVLVTGKVDAAKYVDILSNNLEESATMLSLGSYTFQQGNDPEHTSKLAKSYLTNKSIDLLPWSA
jgi:hypothetical protein